MWVQVMKDKERKFLPASFVEQKELVCLLLNAVQQFGFSSAHHLIQVCQPSSYSFFFFFFCRNPYGQSVGNHRAGLDHVPREWGELLCVHVFSLFCVPFFFFFNNICSICLLIEPSLP